MNGKEPGPEMFGDLPDEAKKIVGDQLASLLQTTTTALIGWGFEVLKHLAIFNAAGLAGATALAQAFASDHNAHRLAVAAADAFIGGLAFSILTMVVVFFTGFAEIGPMARRNIEVMLNVQPLSALKPTRRTWTIVAINWGMATLAIVPFFVGATYLLRIA